MHGRESLACDLMEPLRPRIEAWVTAMFQHKQLDQRHFTRNDNGCMLGKAGREIYYASLDEAIPQWSRRLNDYSRWLSRRLIELKPELEITACQNTGI